MFLPFLISDHSPSDIIIPKGLQRKKKSFRFVNYVADKTEFLDVVKKRWEVDIKGCNMFKVVKKMRYLKRDLNDHNWKNGNLFDIVVVLKQQLKDVQNELKLLHHTAKIKWLKEGDKNSAFFYSILRSRKNKNRVESICGEDGERFERSKVADQFVNHFQNFLRKANPVKPLSDLGDTTIKKLYKEVADSMIIENGKISGELNATLIALVPKIETLGNVSDFRQLLVVMNKLRSYAGRIQLIAIVLRSMYQYWESLYILPLAVVKDLDKLFKRFLWNSGILQKERQEYLGIWFADLKTNEGLVLSLLKVKLKGKSFWELDPDASDSWGWKSMLEIKDKLKPFVIYNIRDGMKTSLWYDKWCSVGPFKNIIPIRLIYKARFKGNETVKDDISIGRWEWPDEWNVSYPL
ncbi:hypothetical protein Tco_1334516 [Tanacetum coccineum]